MASINPIAKAVRFGLLSTAALSVAFAGNVVAEDEIETIEVTGSRIQRTDMETPVPVAVISRENIKAIGALNVADVLNSSPVAVAGLDQSSTSFSTTSVGLNTTALRNLAEERTLVLVNGRRFVSGVSPSSGYAVDLNAIPASMVERIEILKSASSAVYGSDAVAGVVNIITRTDFEGVEINAQAGVSDENDRDTKSIDLITGGSWDTGNAWVSLGYDDDDGLKGSDRDFSKRDTAFFLDENGNEVADDLFSSFPPQGRITYTDADGNRKTLNGDGTAYSGGFNRADYRQLIVPLERKYAAAGIKLDVTDEIMSWTELNYNNTRTKDSTIEPSAIDIVNDIWLQDRNGNGGMDINNPLVPELLRDQLAADGITDLNETTFVRRMVEFGPRSTDLERDTIRFATGLDWDIDGNWMANTYFTWGKTDQTQDNGGQINVERAATALDVIEDANGDLVCRDELARLQGCVPLNFFGEGTVSDDAVDYIKVPAKATGKTEQKVFALGIAGALPFELQGGEVMIAAGYEWREENGSYSPGDLAQTGASSTNKSDPTDGSTRTHDVYAETVLPILDNLELNLAGRYSDHNIVDGHFTWNAGVEYSATDDLKLRASAATAIRTPNVSELYGGRGETFATVADPCNGIDATTPGQVADNCRSIPEIAQRIADEGAFELTQAEAQQTGGTIGGNPKVEEETADSWSVGFIWQATEELSFTVDYWDYAIEDAIAATSRSTVLDRCFDVAAADFDPDCNGASSRDRNGALLEVHSGTSNENDIDTSGLDLEANYNIEIGPGDFKAQLLYVWTREYVETAIDGGSSVDYVGEVTYPEHRANANLSYAMEDLSFAWRVRYWDSVEDSVEGNNLNFTTGDPLE